MPLVRIKDFYPNYKESVFEGQDINSYSVYSENDENIGTVDNILVDDRGNFRYFVIDTGFWIFGKKVLLPVGKAKLDHFNNRVYALGITKEQAENLPEYNEDMVVDYDYEERVRDVYRSPETSKTTNYNRDNYRYDYDPSLYQVNQENNQKLKLYEERLIADKKRYKTGEVAIGKRVETEMAQVKVPVEKERIIVERSEPSGAREVTPGDRPTFKEGEVARMEVYEEEADIKKKAFVREEVSIRKEVERDSVQAKETLRREELDLDVGNNKKVIEHR